MKVETKHLKTVEPVTLDQLQKMSTGSLLTRLKRLRALHERFEDSDWLQKEREAVAQVGLIAFKDQENWQTAFAEVKVLLSEREHLPRGNKENRRSEQQQKQNR